MVWGVKVISGQGIEKTCEFKLEEENDLFSPKLLENKFD